MAVSTATAQARGAAIRLGIAHEWSTNWPSMYPAKEEPVSEGNIYWAMAETKKYIAEERPKLLKELGRS